MIELVVRSCTLRRDLLGRLQADIFLGRLYSLSNHRPSRCSYKPSECHQHFLLRFHAFRNTKLAPQCLTRRYEYGLSAPFPTISHSTEQAAIPGWLWSIESDGLQTCFCARRGGCMPAAMRLCACEMKFHRYFLAALATRPRNTGLVTG